MKLIVEPGKIELSNILSQYNGCVISLTGRITETRTEQPKFAISINANNIPVDSTLKAALPDSQRMFYEYFDISGSADVDIKILGLGSVE